MNTREIIPREFMFLNHFEGRSADSVVPEDAIKAGAFICRREKPHGYLLFRSQNECLQWISQQQTAPCLHEVIFDGPQKLKFDIDAEAEKLVHLPPVQPPVRPAEPKYCAENDDMSLYMNQLLLETYQQELAEYERELAVYNSRTPVARLAEPLFAEICHEICNVFQATYGAECPELMIADSSNEEKFSRHVVIRGHFVANAAEAALFTARLKEGLDYPLQPIVDWGVNKTCQCFRLPGCAKDGTTRVKRIITPDVSAGEMIIQNIAGCSQLKPLIPEIKANEPEHAEISLTNDMEIEARRIAEQALGPAHRFGKIRGNFLNFMRNEPSQCEFCGHEHTNDNTAYAVIVGNGDVLIGCTRAKGKTRKVGAVAAPAQKGPVDAPKTPGRKLPNLAPIMPVETVPSGWDITTYCCEHVKDFGQLPRTLVIKSLMGTGKSFALRNCIATVQAESPKMRIIIVSFRRSFTSEVVSRLENFTDYRTVEKGTITAQHLVVQYESLNRVQLPVGSQCLLILDESESILSQISHKGPTRVENWEKFQWLLEYSTHVISMDAFPSERTYNMIQRMRPGPVSMHINTYKPENGPKDIYYEDSVMWHARLNACITNACAEPIVVVSTSVDEAKTIAQNARERCPNAKIKMYNGESSNKDRRDFDDVNTLWADVDILIYTSTVSAGCSFELARFTRVFGWFVNSSENYNTAVQMLGRVRKISTGEYHIYCHWSGKDVYWASEQQLERDIAAKTYLLGLETNPGNLPRMINAVGEYSYPYKDAYYYANLKNITHRMNSVKHFERLFRGLRLSMGAKYYDHDVFADHQQTQAIKEHQKRLVATVKAAEYKAVATAPVMSFEELDETELRGPESDADRLSMVKTQLCRFYNVPESKITPEFVGRYNKPSSRRLYNRLNKLEMMDAKSLKQAAEELRAARVHKTQSINELEDGKSMVQIMFAMDLLNILMPESAVVNGQLQAVGFADNNRRVIKRAVARGTLETQINEALSYIQEHAGVLCYIFGLRKDRVMKTRADLKSQMKLVNSILKPAIGAIIKANQTSHHHAGGLFFLTAPKIFRYDEKAGMYVPDV